MTPAPIALPDRPLIVRPPGAGLASQAWALVFVAALAAGMAFLLVPQIRDLITDLGLAGKAVPVPGAHVEGRCSTHAGLLTDCDATLTAPGNGGPSRHRKVSYSFVDFHAGDYTVRVLADPARPALLTTDLAMDKLWNRSITLGLTAPLFALLALGLLIGTGKEVRTQRATVRALSNQVLRPVLLRMESYTLGRWMVASPAGRGRTWRMPRRARPIVMDPERRLILGVTAGDGAFTMPLDRRLRWIGVDEGERRALLEALGPNPLGHWLVALDSPAMAAERSRWRRLARGIAIAGLVFGVATGGAALWAFGEDGTGAPEGIAILVFAVCGAFAVGLLLGAARIRAKAARHAAILR